jgi:hypothetical protein
MSNIVTLSPLHQRVLYHQTIREHEPGAVLRNLVSLLDFIRACEIVVIGLPVLPCCYVRFGI